MLLSGVLFFLTYTLTRSNLRAREGELGLSNQLIAETLGSVRASLVLATVITVLVGLILGIVSSERVVRPLAGAADAARAIADGRLDTRLEPTDDPDLNAVTDSFNDMVARLHKVEPHMLTDNSVLLGNSQQITDSLKKVEEAAKAQTAAK